MAQEPGPGTVVESLNLEESELGTLTLGSDDQLRSELETLVNIDDELERFHSESLITDADSHSLVSHEVTVIAEEAEENLSILPDMNEEVIILNFILLSLLMIYFIHSYCFFVCTKRCEIHYEISLNICESYNFENFIFFKLNYSVLVLDLFKLYHKDMS